MPAASGRPATDQRQRRSDGRLKVVSTWIDSELWHRVRVAAVQRHTTIGQMVADAITTHLDRATRRSQ